MPETEILNIIMRYLHIVGAAFAIGASAGMALAVLPTLRANPDAQATAIALSKRLKRLFHMGAGIAILTGMYNYVAVGMPAARAAELKGYDPIIGIKILLALLVMGVGSWAFSREPTADAKGGRMHLLTLVLALVILLLGAVARRMWAV